MADALISPAVGGVMLAATAGTAVYSVKKIQNEMDNKKIPLMGVVGAFVFAAQMINFTIPGTGSSGHIGGGMLLSILLGPQAGFLTMASVLLIQALFFADGGLLAFGCNVFNLGFYTSFIAFPLIYKKLVNKDSKPGRIIAACVLSTVVGLQLGSLSVVFETLLSGKTELPFTAFLLLMQPIHLAIGLVEGFITAAVVLFVWKARPEILSVNIHNEKSMSFKSVIIILAVVTVVIGGGLAYFASSYPDGLEWSIENITGGSEIEGGSAIHKAAEEIQEKTAIMPDYSFKEGNEALGTGVSGIVGGALTLVLASVIGIIISLIKKRNKHGGASPKF